MDVPNYSEEEEDEEKVDLRALNEQLNGVLSLTGWSELFLK